MNKFASEREGLAYFETLHQSQTDAEEAKADFLVKVLCIFETLTNH